MRFRTKHHSGRSPYNASESIYKELPEVKISFAAFRIACGGAPINNPSEVKQSCDKERYEWTSTGS